MNWETPSFPSVETRSQSAPECARHGSRLTRNGEPLPLGGRGHRDAGDRTGDGIAEHPGGRRLTRADGRQDPRLLLGRSCRGERGGDDIHADEGTGLECTAPFLGDDRQVTKALARDASASELLWHQQGEPPELAGAAEVARREVGLAPDQLSHHGQWACRVDETRRGLPEELLVAAEAEFHRVHFRLGRCRLTPARPGRSRAFWAGGTAPRSTVPSVRVDLGRRPKKDMNLGRVASDPPAVCAGGSDRGMRCCSM